MNNYRRVSRGILLAALASGELGDFRHGFATNLAKPGHPSPVDVVNADLFRRRLTACHFTGFVR